MKRDSDRSTSSSASRDRRLKTRDHEFAARGIARKNCQGVAAERRGAAIVNDAHHEIRPCGLEDERAVRRALRDVRLKEHDRLNAAPPRFFEKADFGDGREQALIGAMPDVDDLWRLVGDEQAVEERNLPLDLAEVDDVRRFRKEHCIKRLPEIRVEAFDADIARQIIIGQQTRRCRHACSRVRRANEERKSATRHVVFAERCAPPPRPSIASSRQQDREGRPVRTHRRRAPATCGRSRATRTNAPPVGPARPDCR